MLNNSASLPNQAQKQSLNNKKVQTTKKKIETTKLPIIKTQ